MTTKNAMDIVGNAIAKGMSGLNRKWALEKQYDQWDREQIKLGNHRFLFGKKWSGWTYRSEWNFYLSKIWKHDGIYHISGDASPSTIGLKRMSAKIQRRILAIDEEIKKLHKKKQLILARHFKDAKEVSMKQVFNHAKKIRAKMEEFGIKN